MKSRKNAQKRRNLIAKELWEQAIYRKKVFKDRKKESKQTHKE